MLLKDNIKKPERGILLPISSLPSNYGIGTFGIEAYDFIDLLKETKQDYWQILPLCPVGKGNSPYASTSTFAGEILYIDLDFLVNDGLLKKSEIPDKSFRKRINYNSVRKFKIPLLISAAKRVNTNNYDYKTFYNKSRYWLNDFAEFMSTKEGLPKEFYFITQFIFFKQYYNLHNYAIKNDIKIIGDIPFYVDLNSVDVWSNPQIFKLDKNYEPVLVAGVPPDIFSKKGQLWGNPIYDWDFLKTIDYSWWKKRILHNAELYDVIRIDHFRAFSNYYCIPIGMPDATFGFWKGGVGIDFWTKIKPFLKKTKIIAEDLGGEDDPEVIKLLKQTGFQNMKVLQFAFDSDFNDPYLPQNFNSNCVCYTGTHDNDTTLGWYQKASYKEKKLFNAIVPKKYDSPVLNLISFAMNSKAKLVIIPFFDYLELNSDNRINIPSVPNNNWEWRFSKTDITDELKNKIKYI